MSDDLLFPEDGEVRSTGKPHRSPTHKKKRVRKRQRQAHGLKDGEIPEDKKACRRKEDRYFAPALETRDRPYYLPSLSDPDPFLIERLLGTPLVF